MYVVNGPEELDVSPFETEVLQWGRKFYNGVAAWCLKGSSRRALACRVNSLQQHNHSVGYPELLAHCLQNQT